MLAVQRNRTPIQQLKIHFFGDSVVQPCSLHHFGQAIAACAWYHLPHIYIVLQASNQSTSLVAPATAFTKATLTPAPVST